MYVSESGATIVARDSIGPGSGPVFLDQLYCSESDVSLQTCERGIAAVGLSSCGHTQDIQILCEGTNILKLKAMTALPFFM